MGICSVVVELEVLVERVRSVGAGSLLASGALVERVRSVGAGSLLVLGGVESGVVCYPRQP